MPPEMTASAAQRSHRAYKGWLRSYQAHISRVHVNREIRYPNSMSQLLTIEGFDIINIKLKWTHKKLNYKILDI